MRGRCVDENADCKNIPGSYACKCRSGWVGDGHSCTATQWRPLPTRIRVELDGEMQLGWRVKEVELFQDGECKTPLLEGPGAEPGAEFSWVQY